MLGFHCILRSRSLFFPDRVPNHASVRFAILLSSALPAPVKPSMESYAGARGAAPALFDFVRLVPPNWEVNRAR